ncbi:MAG: HD domain-containing phosphohydrolase [Pseudanabaenaceae cyanobacterium SKYGB_i_bin29]|nr:GAF domain-containing protein [Pseudanabaenaceae cyanobacterium SKYG29]MDW8422598.1 HD domain-containing phosphohydrolase [Pseudanabaenaceae cyanobacterium SKYGB_i_bin29]
MTDKIDTQCTEIAATVEKLEKLNAIGIALSAERHIPTLLEMILRELKQMLGADGGTIYMLKDNHLHFNTVLNTSLNIYLGGVKGKPVTLPPIPLYQANGEPNYTTVAACCALKGETINIPDAYRTEGFDFAGMREFDRLNGYHSQSFLTVPMKNHEEEVIGVVQLINAKDDSGQIIPFSPFAQRIAESLASQAAIAITNQQLINEFRELFEAFIKVIAEAIDEKSEHTGQHCRRVPVLTMMLAEAACNTKSGVFKDFTMTEEELYELKIAGLLHDCGKVTTPVHVIEKATKLQTIYDRIGLIDTRFAALKKDLEIELLQKKIAVLEGKADYSIADLEKEYAAKVAQLESDRQFLRHCNIGSEYMSDDLKERVKAIGQYQWWDFDGNQQNFLTEDEIYNLNITKGTLTKEEREIINRHIVVTIKMLESLPYPKNLRRVPEYAGGHHERMDGKGYPRGLTREQMSIPARMMGIADIFEALSASDRPYKPGKKLSECLHILGKMKLDNHIDPDLFDLFIREKVYLKYAQMFLPPEQIDEVDESKIPGYNPTIIQ